jgi:hypothetical protein
MSMTATQSIPSIRDVRVDVRLKHAIRNFALPKQLLIVGPAGTGKTFGVLAFLHLLAADIPNVRILVCRQTRVSLTESVLVTYEQEILPADGMEFISRGVSRRNRSGYFYPNGSQISLGGLEDARRVLSSAWDVVYVNEAIEVEESSWDTLSTRLNRPGRRSRFGYLIGDTNPGDPAHWLKAHCDDGRIASWEAGHKANPALWDGLDWTPAGDAYLESLGKLRGTRRKRLLEGLWAAGEGAWFETFDSSLHVSDRAEFDPRFPVHLAVDTGVHTGAVWFQVVGSGIDAEVRVFGDYYSATVPAFENARLILERSGELTGRGTPDHYGRTIAPFDVGRMDPSGNSNNGTGVVIGSEFLRAGLKLQPWPKFPGCVASGLALVESFVAVDPPKLLIHPRCRNLIDAFANYKRKRRGGQWIDDPEDPQHPYEDLIDSLRSGLLDKFPEGRKPDPGFMKVPGRRAI